MGGSIRSVSDSDVGRPRTGAHSVRRGWCPSCCGTGLAARIPPALTGRGKTQQRAKAWVRTVRRQEARRRQVLPPVRCPASSDSRCIRDAEQSSYSSGAEGNCVTTAILGRHMAVRDSKLAFEEEQGVLLVQARA
ncbi:DUF397 domain-containing protein [Streptomyces sp. NPDC051000]|uniref:DUF397 domain-containing protein n=1 Tax=Streptomyces sp. NPDC051000 TaxID=3155520 RepID=UPI0033C2FBBF